VILLLLASKLASIVGMSLWCLFFLLFIYLKSNCLK
jgi:hypothetical protein